jgi:uncharacterized membrane protein
VGGHLDRRFAELEPKEQTWENFQKIVTEMGPPSDYAELAANGKKTRMWAINKLELAASVLIFIAFFGSVYFYQRIPERMATHWDFRGQVNGYMPKSVGLFLMPGILAVFIIAVIVVPRVVTVSANIEGFRKFFGGLTLFLSIFLTLVHYQMILWNIGIKINPAFVAIPTIAGLILFIAVWFYGNYRKSRKMNL